METVTLSPDHQIAIPQSIRELLNLEPGDRFRMTVFSGRIELISLGAIEEMRGILKGRGIDAQIEREADDL